MVIFFILFTLISKGSGDKMKADKNLIGELRIMKDFRIKPNYSALEREYGLDRHTIKKYFDNDGIPKRKEVNRPCKWDEFYDEIEELMGIVGVTKTAAYQCLKYKYGEAIGNYNGFKAYTLRKGITCKKVDVTPHLLYETDPGEQIQCDWKESLVTHNKDGEEYHYNVFSATLGYSREHIFIYTIGKTEDDFIRCVIAVFKKLGGKTKVLKTDNMSAIVSIKDGKRVIHKRIQSFFKDIDVELELCDIRSPMTKGKDECANKFVNWIKAFDYKIKDEAELIQVIEEYITEKSNSQINSRTQVPPSILFKKEKDYLKPIGNEMNLQTYIQNHKRTKVPNTLLISYESKQYSVPSPYIGKYVDVYSIGDELYIYHNHTLIAVHSVSEKLINYNNDHYKEGLNKRLGTNCDDIEELAKKNLERLNKLGGD